MAFTRRLVVHDATWARAWTADALVDLAVISALPFNGPKRGDFAFVTATGLYYLWMDDGSWRPLIRGLEERDWTPTDASGSGLIFPFAEGKSLKVDHLVIAFGDVTYPLVGVDAMQSAVGGIPWACEALTHSGYTATVSFSNNAAGIVFTGIVVQATQAVVFRTFAGVVITNHDMSLSTVRFTALYKTAP
jgi:hypothetical protein